MTYLDYRPWHNGSRITCLPIGAALSEAEAEGAEALVLEGVVAEFALAVEEHGAAQRVVRLTIVGTGVAALAERRFGQPPQQEYRKYLVLRGFMACWFAWWAPPPE